MAQDVERLEGYSKLYQRPTEDVLYGTVRKGRWSMKFVDLLVK